MSEVGAVTGKLKRHPRAANYPSSVTSEVSIEDKLRAQAFFGRIGRNRQPISFFSGQAIVFNHYRLHEGARLTAGLKYILRTDILFEREGPADLSDSQRRAIELLQRAEVLETNHREMEAADCYRRAFKICPELEDCL